MSETGEYYEGKVTDYDAEHKWYKIKYLDGDEEEFDEEELTLHRRVGTIIRRELSESGKYHEGEVIEFDNTRKLYRVKYPDGKEEDIGVEDLKEHRTQNQKTVQKRTKQFRQRSRSLKIDAEDWKLSEKDRESLSCADENFLAKFEEFLEYENRISEQNKRNVMRQVRKLASGEGIRYEVCDSAVTQKWASLIVPSLNSMCRISSNKHCCRILKRVPVGCIWLARGLLLQKGRENHTYV